MPHTTPTESWEERLNLLTEKWGGVMWAFIEKAIKAFIKAEITKAVQEDREKHRLKKCPFCKRKYRTQRGLSEHSSKCYKNPERHCPTCEGTGMIDEVMSNGYMGHQNYPCPDCATAERIKKELSLPVEEGKEL